MMYACISFQCMHLVDDYSRSLFSLSFLLANTFKCSAQRMKLQIEKCKMCKWSEFGVLHTSATIYFYCCPAYAIQMDRGTWKIRAVIQKLSLSCCNSPYGIQTRAVILHYFLGQSLAVPQHITKNPLSTR